MAETLRPRVLVVGGGMGGYVAAIRASQLGLDTVLVEKDRLGGTCLIRGCIPSKAVIHAADRYAEIANAVGGNALGIALDGKPRLDLARMVKWKDGIVDRLNKGVGGLLDRAKVRVVPGWAVFSDAKTCRVETAEGVIDITAEHVVLATGSEPAPLAVLPFGANVISSTEALSLTELPQRLAIIGAGYIGLELVIAFKKLGAAVTIIKAAAQGAMVAEIIAGARRHFDPNLVAAVCFTEPEIVTAGLSPNEAVAAGFEITTAQFPFAASGRALTLEAGGDGGFVRIVAQKEDQRVLGIQAVGHQIAELAGEFAHALAMGAVLDDLAHTIHVHPTLGEAVGEAALVGLGHGLHI